MTADTLQIILLGMAFIAAVIELARSEAQSLVAWSALFIVVALLLPDLAGRL